MTVVSYAGWQQRHAEPQVAESQQAGRPLIIDVDGTLLRTDLLIESLIAYLKPNPLRIAEVAGWLFAGKANLKRKLAERVTIDVETLPVNEDVVQLAQEASDNGRPVYLASASDISIIERLKNRFAFVTGVLASDGATNLKGSAKAEALKERFPEGFDYAGDAAADLDVWPHAKEAIVVNASGSVARRAAKVANVTATIKRPSRFAGLPRGLRLHQWAKNILVFTPIVLGGQIGHLYSLMLTALAFVSLGLIASSTYLINDILDVADDRRHWSKRNRPIASGRLGIPTAAAVATLGIAAGLGLAAYVSLECLGVAAAYLVLTLCYSIGLKRTPLLDGLVLATLFTTRLVLGVVAASVPPSPWLFVFSMFLFTSLSFSKRYTELSRVIKNKGQKIAGRGYREEDAPLVLALGVASGLGAVIMTIFYIIDDAFRQSFYGSSFWLWAFPPLVFLFICRIWLKSVRGEMSDDPVEFALRDRLSQFVIAAFVVSFVCAWLG